MGKLSTHVLDTANGCPGQGIKIELFRLDANNTRSKVVETSTNSDGRTDQPLLSGEDFKSGVYEIDFHIGDYFKNVEKVFLDVVTVRFNANSDENYHVPLLASPYGYTTYRGS